MRSPRRPPALRRKRLTTCAFRSPTPPATSAYPISSYTYILAYKEQKDAAKGKALVDFLWWGIHDGEQFAKDLQYAPLPAEIVKRAEAKINSITAGGKAAEVESGVWSDSLESAVSTQSLDCLLSLT